MSSAAVQPQSPHSHQQYGEHYTPTSAAHASAAPTTVSSPQSASRRPVGNTSGPNTPQQQQSQYSSAAMGSPRGQDSPGMNASTYAQFYPEPATSLPIRAATSYQSQSPNPAPASYDSRGYSSRPQSQSQSHAQTGYGSGSDSDRRRTTQPSREEQPGSGRSQRTRNAPTSSRSSTAVGQPPMGTDLPRENSAVINRIVVDDPQEDVARAEARKAEGRPLGTTNNMQDVAEAAPVQRSRQEHLKHGNSHKSKEVKFGDYILGQTIGEGEFGKVKMGWKKDSTVQVAIKLIRKESLAGNTTRLPKIYREIHILRELQHPNIVRLHEFVETERHMGIILEYASGGELFDYILNHRYLKDPAARRLFAQLVSGVGYLHKKGIVHRDLKLENLLLDRNKHIIITDFGFANTFNPEDELGEEAENRIGDKNYIKSQGLDKVIPWRDGRDGGHRRGDLMQTSCGSPCYAAPELVVSDGLYTGRKVDVWSCGVILYAMLAGYLPFDDDPANPEGDNINLLYKYIVSTPLTFPEYVTPHARDLLRRILVPDPRRRADLFEVARHSWLSEYTHVVGFIGSRVKSDVDPVSVRNDGEPQLGRSASVREPTTRGPADRSSMSAAKHAVMAGVGGDEANDMRNKTSRDQKRRTVQLEYVAPNVANPRGDSSQDLGGRKAVSQSAGTASRTRARADGHGPVEVTSSRQDGSMLPPSSRPQQRAVSDATTGFGTSAGSTARPTSMSGALGVPSRLPSRGNSYSQPSAAQPTTTTAQGKISQPKSGSGYMIAGGSAAGEAEPSTNATGRPSTGRKASGRSGAPSQQKSSSGHKRSSTLGSLADKVMNRNSSRRSTQQESAAAANEKRDRRYPPVSMKNAMPNADIEQPRPSTDGRRPSFGFNRKASKEGEASISSKRTSRRFSWLPGSLSMSNFGGKKDQNSDSGDDGYRPPRSQQSQQSRSSRPGSKGVALGRGESSSPAGSNTINHEERRGNPSNLRYDKALPPSPTQSGLAMNATPPLMQRKQFRDDGYGNNMLEQDPPERFYTPVQNPGSASEPNHGQQYVMAENGDWEEYDAVQQPQQIPQRRDQSLRPHQRRMGDAYDHGHGGSSSATRRVMDFFRRRGKDRGEL
ncbi:unnamed protein product [Zymoseptoria tritici ST99CH_1A5]|uniref:Serine/threonine protein kinase n=2 Tax=Zymoseptoria tritici TaxID=1047171 RepID=F9WZS5_ZYMTI|nr:Serine/threonine protein kinase [Zymoseptoria tritici IPO323]EGP92575.1 Serine/threonine protein kinase [Zymoseptoria tritici IPO323]SMY19065.1 unnamed protein product [Zymoseptoria tritici ST99CH_1A5]